MNEATAEERIIHLSQGKVAIVEAQDYDRVSRFKWSYHNAGYAQRNDRGKIILMHRFINGTPAGMDTDHIDGNKLNNRRSNLRTASHAENMRNMRSRANKLKGASFNKRSGKWRACIKTNYKEKHLGYFATPEAAHAAYCAAATQMHGDFARTL